MKAVSYLGTATVTRAVGDRIEVTGDALGEALVARSALAFPYQPVRGDELLVIADHEACFIIGVVEGRGRPRLEGPELSLSVGGTLRLSGGKEVSLDTAQAQVLAQRELAQESHYAVKESGRLTQQVFGAAKALRRDYDQIIASDWIHHARRITAKVKKTFHVNGGRIHLS